MFRLLGPVRLDRLGQPPSGGVEKAVPEDVDQHIDLGPSKQRVLLAALLLTPGQVVPTEVLVDRVWGDNPPQRARNVLATYVTRLRRAVEPVADGSAEVVRLRYSSGGYRIECDRARVDLHRARTSVSEARAAGRAGDAQQAAELFRAALDGWQPVALAGVSGEWAARVRDGLHQERLGILAQRAEADLQCGRHAEVVEELRALVAENPTAEGLLAPLLIALDGTGRSVEALDCYARAQKAIVEDLGSQPSSPLRELHLRILRNDPTIARRRNPAEAGGSVRSAGPVSNLIGPGASLTGLAAKGPAEVRVVPAQLPADVAAFTGRGGELAELDAVLVGPPSGSANEHDSRAVVISAVSGTAGVGKTALVVHWAHRVRKEFPDGQLYVNLRGYDPDRPMTAAEALAGFLGGLGVASQQVPLELAERAARFRTEVSGRRMLIVLDNASSLEQIRPLLPGTSSSAVVVTSRDSLAGLVAVHGAHRLDLDLLAPNEAIGLLRRLIGRGVDAEPEAAAGLAAHCARLPLALRVAAELAISRPGMGLADLVAELDDEQWRLELLNAEGDPNVPVGAVFSWSVRHLTPDAARAFALLGLHPGPNFDAHAAAALAGSSPQRAGRTLGLLVRAHLIHPTAAGRYGMHDLLRAYARHLTTQLNNRSTAQPIAQVTSGNDNEETSKGDVDSALSRLFDYYLCAVAAAMDALNRNGKAGPHPGPGIPAAATPAPLLPDQATARAWLDAELPTLTSVAAYTAAHGWPGHTVRLSTTLSHYLNGGGNHAEALAIQGHAHCASRQIGDRAAQAQALHGLGAVHLRMVRYGRAVEEFQQALALFRQLGDRVGQARALGALGTLERRLGRNQAAVGYAREAVALDREAGDWSGQAHALIGLGIVEARLGLYRQATEHHQQALALGRRVGDRSAEGWALGGLGVVETRTGRHAQAGEHLQQAMALTGQIGDEFGQGWALTSLGTLQIRLEGFEQATEYHRQALAIFRRIGDRDGEVWALNGLGEAAHAGTGTVGDPVVALTHHLTALTIATDIGIRDQQARANFGLGHSYLAIEEPTRACEHFERALTRYTELGMPDADAVHSELATLVQTVQKPDPVYAGAHSIQPQSN